MNYEDSFYVNVVSSHCLDQYSRNSSSFFSNYFWPPIKLEGTYYVALCSISFADKYKQKPLKELSTPGTAKESTAKQIRAKPTIRPSTTTESTWSVFDKPQPKIRLIETTVNSLDVLKEENDTPLSYVSGLGLRFNVKDLLEINQDFQSGSDLPVITFDVKDQSVTLRLDSNLSNFLGFGGKIDLPYGTNTADTIVQKDLFDSVPAETSSELIVQKESSLDFEEPEYDPEDPGDYQDQVCENAVLTLKRAKISVSMRVNKQGVLVVRFAKGTIARYMLPETVNERFGLDPDYQFHSDIDIPLPEKAGEGIKANVRDLAELEREKILKDTLVNQVLVSTNITEAIRFGSSFRPIIRTIPRGFNSPGPYQHHEFHPLQFHKVIHKELTNISIGLSDSKFSFLPEALYPTSVLLLFVKTRL